MITKWLFCNFVNFFVKIRNTCESRGPTSQRDPCSIQTYVIIDIRNHYPFIFLVNIRHDVWSGKNCLADVTPIMVSWHYQEPVALLKTPNHATAIQYYPRRVFIRVSPIIPSWHEMPYNCARSRRREYKRTSHVSLDRVGYKRSFS